MHELLSIILSSKAKIAVLRVLSSQDNLSARQIQNKSGKSWGAVKPALTTLQEMHIVEVKKRKWNDEIRLNRHHLLAQHLIDLFKLERDFLYLLGKNIFTFSQSIGTLPVSCYLFTPKQTLYLICRSSNVSRDKNKSCLKYLKSHGLPGVFSFHLIQSAAFSTLWYAHDNSDNFICLHGETFPFKGLQGAYDFFNIDISAPSVR